MVYSSQKWNKNEESLFTEPSSSMASASQNSPKSDSEARKDAGSDTITLILPRNFFPHPMITSNADRTKLSNPQLMMNAFAILVFLNVLKAKYFSI